MKGDVKMLKEINYSNMGKKLEPYPVALALFYIFTILYAVCIGIKLILTSMGINGFWHMHRLWETILPWFGGLDFLSIIIGLLEVSLGSYLIGYIVVPTYNFLTRKKVSEHKIEVKPVIVRFKTLFITFVLYISILFTLCLIYDLIVPVQYQMLPLWKMLLPGFTGLNISSYLIGLGIIIIYSAYTAFIFSKTLNYFEKSELKKSGNNVLSQVEKQQAITKKYSEKYFGIAAGTFAVIIFLVAAIKMIFSGNDYSGMIKPFIPFFNSMNVLNLIGGIIVSFLWGWLLGYFFLVFYNWFDKKLYLDSKK